MEDGRWKMEEVKGKRKEIIIQKKRDCHWDNLSQKKWRPPTLPHCIAVPSAQAGLTSLFGMGRGGTPPQ